MWPILCLQDVATLVRRPVIVDPHQYYTEIGIRSFGRGIFHKEPRTGLEIGEKRVFEIKPGDLVFNIVFAWEGAVAVAGDGERSTIGSHRFLTFHADENLLDPNYAQRYFSSPRGRKYLLDASPGSAGRNKTLGLSAAARLPIPLPPLDEQRRIVDLLERAAGIRRLREQALAKARAIVPALFLDMFGDPATNPKGWPTTFLGDVLASGPQNGLYRPASDYGDGVRILRIDSFDDASISNIESLKRLKIDSDTTDRYGLAAGDIVINRVNSPPQLGKSVLIPPLGEPVVFESNMMRMRVDSNRLLPEVVIEMLQLGAVRQDLTRNAKHAINQSSINQTDVRSVRVPLLPLVSQRLYADRLANLRSIIAQQERSLAAARELERSLMARLLG